MLTLQNNPSMGRKFDTLNHRLRLLGPTVRPRDGPHIRSTDKHT